MKIHIYFSKEHNWHYTKCVLSHNHELQLDSGINTAKSEISEELLAYIQDQVVRLPVAVLLNDRSELD